MHAGNGLWNLLPADFSAALTSMKLSILFRSSARWPYLLGFILFVGMGWLIFRPNKGPNDTLIVSAQRGPLDIKVLVGGSLEALESQELRSEVRGEPVKIVKIVEEGYQVTEEDVKAHKVLVQLDDSKLKQNLVNQDINFQSTVSGLTEAQQSFEIQINQNKTDMKAAEQKTRFSLMDVKKYLGGRITDEIVSRLGLSEDLLSRSNSVVATSKDIDFSLYVKDGLLDDGAAKQDLRKHQDELLIAQTARGQAETKLTGTKRLFAKGFVPKSELENDQIASDQTRLKVDAATTARDLFVKYEFPKLAEESLSKYDEALQGLIRARKESVSKLAQTEAKLKAAKGRYQIEKENLDELAAQIEKCLLYAKTPGLVVYGGGNQRGYWNNNERIAVGSQVFERQALITIPDPKKMGVKVGVHESHIKKVKKGLKVQITADAFPDDPLTGEVTKVGVLPDSENRWMNPDLKLYTTTIAINGTRDWLKPGMSAKIEIMVKRLEDIVFVPLQAVSQREGKPVVFLSGRPPKPVEIEPGEFTDEFIEIKKGLAFGDQILLRAPDSERSGSEEKKEGAPVSAQPPATGIGKPSKAL